MHECAVVTSMPECSQQKGCAPGTKPVFIFLTHAGLQLLQQLPAAAAVSCLACMYILYKAVYGRIAFDTRHRNVQINRLQERCMHCARLHCTPLRMDKT